MNEPMANNNDNQMPVTSYNEAQNTSSTATANPGAGPETETKPVLNEKTLMAVLAYVGPLVLVPLFTKRDDPAIMFHVRQGLVLFAIGALLWVVSRWFMIGFLWPLISLLNFALLVLSIIGIFNVLNRKEVPLPLVGSFSKYFNF